MQMDQLQQERPYRELTLVENYLESVIEADLSDRAIVLLINSPLYFLDWVIIVLERGQYRLLVSRFGEIPYDRYFESIGEAKARFFDDYQFLAFNGVDEPSWSVAYFPLKKWLKTKLDKTAPNII